LFLTAQTKEHQEMANYQLIYQCLFDSLKSEHYTLQILKKDYTGTATNVKGGATPVLHDWQTDDPKAPVKGSSLSITLINEGSLPLESFYSIDDDTFKVVLLWNDQSLFEGFIVQDDCSEEMVDYTHEINLSANDNLGLLKDLTLDKADAAFTYTSVGSIAFNSVTPHTLNVSSTAGVQIQPGDKIKITGSDADGTYTAQLVTDNGATFGITVVEEIVTASGTVPFSIGKISLLDKKPLLTIIGMCLQLTGLQLNLNVWSQINEVSQDQTKCFLEQTLVDPGTFLKDSDTYEDCYTILTNILGAFNFTLFQSLGAWHMVRWDELRYFNNRVPAYIYNYDMSFNGYAFMQVPFDAGFGKLTYGETGLLHRIIRPFSFDKETFNYKQPPQLLRNYDLKTLGTLLRTYTVNIWIKGGQTYYSNPGGTGVIATFQRIREYNAPWWYQNDRVPNNLSYFIRVTTDSIDNEIDRRLVIIRQDAYDFVKSYQIEASAGDVFTFSFTCRTSKYPQRDPMWVSILVQLYDGTSNKMVSYNPGPSAPRLTTIVKAPEWTDLPSGTGLFLGYVVTIPNGKPDSDFNVEVDMSHIPVPNDGLLYVNLSSEMFYQKIDNSIEMAHFDEITYKDIRLSYTPLVNQTTKIIGQTHTTSQVGNVKNNNDSEIFIDSSPRNSIAGTLFLNQMDGVLQKRTVKWRHPYLSQSENLGNLVTFEEMFWRRKPRTIIEGTLHGLTLSPPNPYGCNIYETIDPLHNTEHVVISWTSTPVGTTGVVVSYYDGTWHDNAGTTSPITLDLTAGNYAFKISFTGTSEVFYFNDFNNHFSMLSIVRYAQFSGFNFVSGKQTIDYKNDKFTGTLYEIWDDGEKDSDLTDTYQFNYLYDPI
jgi:hypothetical protein